MPPGRGEGTVGAIRSDNDEIDKLILDLSTKAASCGR